MAGRADEDGRVHLVTSARRPHSEEMSTRFRRYLLSMAVRTIALVLAIFVFHGWLRLVCLAAGLALPWLAVVLANAGPVADDTAPDFVAIDRPELESGSTPPAADPPRTGPATPQASSSGHPRRPHRHFA